MQSIGILGGTFDPIHFGHLRIALEFYQQLSLDEVRFIPCQKPVLAKFAQTTWQQRLAMLQLALHDQPAFVIDERELQRKTPSYTVETLISLRTEFSHSSLYLLLGSDTLPTLDQWYRWQELIHYAHLIIAQRPNSPSLPPNSPITQYLQQYTTHDLHQLANTTHGYVYSLPVTALDISATAIRQQVSSGQNPRYLLPDAVLDYIRQEKLYSVKP